MLTRLIVRNFKRFKSADIELGNPVVFVGPNNSGKTTALQALALWDIGLKRWNEKRGGRKMPETRTGVAINRRDLINLPVPDANLLWRDLHVRDVQMRNGKPKTSNVRIEIIVEGTGPNGMWKCGLEFDYANEESFYCRLLREETEASASRKSVPPEASSVNIAFLPPMSGLAANETRLDVGAVNVRIGEGRTADVLRNLCYRLVEQAEKRPLWERLLGQVRDLFGVHMDEPVYVSERGEITMSCREASSAVRLDLSSAGRGLQQVLLLLAYIYANPRTVLLLDEPDAHLEILRQRQIYQVVTEVAASQGCQVIAASHSEVLLDEAAGRDVVVAFVGKPHRIDDRGSQVLKSLREIGFEHYYQAEHTGWVLYLEGATDLAILRSFARILNHPAANRLERPFVHYVLNQPQGVRSHFFGLREAKPDLVGFALFDRIDQDVRDEGPLRMHKWSRNEIENYLCRPETLLTFAETSAREIVAGPIFEGPEAEKRRAVMEKCIRDFAPPAALRDGDDPWWLNVKASDEFLDRVFEAFYGQMGLPNLMRKSNYHKLAECVQPQHIASEVKEVLDRIVQTAEDAKPAAEEIPS